MMNFQVHLVLLGILLVVGSRLLTEARLDYNSSTFHRSSFPKNFVFGTASSSYQYEGAYNKDGRTPSMWDTYTHQYPGKIADHSNGDVANDQYNRYKEDVALMKDMGMNAYRFSISWSRVLPTGKLSGGVNKKGIQYYNNLINELLSRGVQPYVTLFHWDMPQTLEDEFGGFLSSNIVSHFQDFAEVCYKAFGDRVKHWITLNEPWTYANVGYNLGSFPPNRCSKYVNNCTAGDSSTEPYIAGHNQLLAHAAAVKIYREKYQTTQKGIIGITLVSHWMVPASKSKADKDAAQRAIDFMFGWFMDPVTFGRYPKSMQSLVGKRLPKFTEEESNLVKGSYDFLGLNYYTANYATSTKLSNGIRPSYLTDSRANLATERNGIPIGPAAASPWLFMYPSGFQELLLYTKYRYNNPVIYITENGVDEINNSTLTLKEALVDNMRIDYHSSHLKFLLRSIKQGVDVRGYFAWSLLDNFEWGDGYSVRFGINYVDFKTLERYPKHSSTWFKKFLHNI
ncbi:beta-glucosidase [Ranunculus cassubicifolius]